MADTSDATVLRGRQNFGEDFGQEYQHSTECSSCSSAVTAQAVMKVYHLGARCELSSEMDAMEACQGTSHP